MFRRSAKNFLRDNLFSAIMILAAVIVTTILSLAISYSACRDMELRIPDKDDPSGSQPYKQFAVFCFDNKLIVSCGLSFLDSYCSETFKRQVKDVCADMERAGIWPFDEIKVDIKKFDVCDKDLEKRTGCLPSFTPGDKIGGHDTGVIQLPARIFSDKKQMKEVLTHELAHALTRKHWSRMARVVKEFFAVYTEIQFSDSSLANCNGAEWNQPALRNYGGEYIFPPKKDHRPMDLLSSCRYGQLEHIVRQIHRKSPFLFEALWYELENNEDGRIDTVWLKRQIAAIDSEAGELVSQFHILNEADANSQLAIVGNAYEHCVFIYKNTGASEEYYSERAGFQMEWRRGGKHLAWSALSHAPVFCYPADKFLSGDVLQVRATGFGKSFYRLFVIP